MLGIKVLQNLYDNGSPGGVVRLTMRHSTCRCVVLGVLAVKRSMQSAVDPSTSSPIQTGVCAGFPPLLCGRAVVFIMKSCHIKQYVKVIGKLESRIDA
jgi:hypothetical protein